ncbi:MAG: hypothetical protein ACPGPF_09280, partial [Pontibacterium sp.]
SFVLENVTWDAASAGQSDTTEGNGGNADQQGSEVNQPEGEQLLEVESQANGHSLVDQLDEAAAAVAGWAVLHKGAERLKATERSSKAVSSSINRAAMAELSKRAAEKRFIPWQG